jgi:hypothetical protein
MLFKGAGVIGDDDGAQNTVLLLVSVLIAVPDAVLLSYAQKKQ